MNDFEGAHLGVQRVKAALRGPRMRAAVGMACATIVAWSATLSLPIHAGEIVAWGNNKFGQRNVPRGKGFRAVAGGRNFAVAIRFDGSLIAWGDNQFGQMKVPSGKDFVAVTTGQSEAFACDQMARSRVGDRG